MSHRTRLGWGGSLCFVRKTSSRTRRGPSKSERFGIPVEKEGDPTNLDSYHEKLGRRAPTVIALTSLAWFAALFVYEKAFLADDEVVDNIFTKQPCGTHGLLLVDRCWCNPGYEGSTCDKEQTNVTIPKCSLKPLSDLCMNTNNFGHLETFSAERKAFAGTCEMAFWKKPEVPMRNADQARQFDNFADLPSRLIHVLELGSGPYTKLRLILERGMTKRTVSTATFVDPSAVRYIPEARQVSYPDGKFCLNATRGFEGGCIPTLLGAFGGEVPLMEDAYDTVIMMNTLEHVYSAFELMTNFYRALKPGGIAVYAEIFGSKQEMSSSNRCHPITQMRAFPEYSTRLCQTRRERGQKNDCLWQYLCHGHSKRHVNTRKRCLIVAKAEYIQLMLGVSRKK